MPEKKLPAARLPPRAGGAPIGRHPEQERTYS